MHLADGAMYWAKSRGRDRTFIYSSDKDFALSAQEAADRVAHEGLINTVHALAKAVDTKDGYTASHSQRVARYAATLAARAGFEAEHVERIRTAGILHDVGKIGISDVLLLQPGRLSDEQFATMRRHSELGRDIIAGAGMDEIGRFVLHLHERWDGRGYPDGVSGEDIPVESRILHIADALEAMTSTRVYRGALPLATALGELEKHAGAQFDPRFVPHMLELVRSGELEVAGERQEALDVLSLRGSQKSSNGNGSGVTPNGNGNGNGAAANGASVNGHGSAVNGASANDRGLANGHGNGNGTEATANGSGSAEGARPVAEKAGADTNGVAEAEPPVRAADAAAEAS